MFVNPLLANVVTKKPSNSKHSLPWLKSVIYTLVMAATVIYHALRALGMINPIATYTLVYNLYVMV